MRLFLHFFLTKSYVQFIFDFVHINTPCIQSTPVAKQRRDTGYFHQCVTAFPPSAPVNPLL